MCESQIVDGKIPYSPLWLVFIWECWQVRLDRALIAHSSGPYTPLHQTHICLLNSLAALVSSQPTSCFALMSSVPTLCLMEALLTSLVGTPARKCTIKCCKDPFLEIFFFFFFFFFFETISFSPNSISA
jgi:hypothetical protein